LLDASFKNLIFRDRKESLRQGIKAAATDLKLYASDWGFSLKDIKIPVYLWYGKSDKNVSLAMGKYYASQIPQSILTIYDGGHFSWIHSQNNVVMTCTSRVTDIFLELIPIPWGIGRTIAVF